MENEYAIEAMEVPIGKTHHDKIADRYYADHRTPGGAGVGNDLVELLI